MKAMKNMIWMAALALTASSLTSCSVEDDPVAEQTPAKQDNIVTLTATLGPKGGGSTTRALTENGSKIESNWAVNEEVCVKYTNTSDDFVDAKGIITAVDGSGSATITVNLVNPKDGNSNICFHYPYSIAAGGKDLKTDQIGTLADIAANFDDVTGDGTLNVSAGVATLPTGVAMTRNVCIWKFDFSTPTTSDITSLNIKVGDIREIDVKPTSLDAIYVALPACTSETITLTAATATGIYSYSKDGVSLTNGKYYRSSTVAMSPAAASSKYRQYLNRTAYNDVDIPDGATTVTSTTTAWAAGTYVVSSDVTIDSDITLSGDVNLILKDGAELTVHGCIFGGADYDHGFQYALNIYGQELSTGKLTIDYSGNHSLGVMTASELNIHGGIITVGGTSVYQGMEPNVFNVYHGTINARGAVNGIIPMGNTHIYGGSITAVSTSGYGPALSLPNGGKTLTISGGTVTATNNGASTGIEAVHSIVISGGTVYADGQGGGINVSGNSDVTCTISGGTVIATSNGGPGINVSNYSTYDSHLTISGGTITAHGGDGSAAGICGEIIAISGATTEINATGGEQMEGIIAYGASTISGGSITARGGGEGGIGLEGTFTISGGTITAIGGDDVENSMENGAAGFDGALTMTGGKLIATGGAKAGDGSDGLGIAEATTITLSGVTMYEGESANPATPAANQTACTKRYVIIQ